jgi:galactoside O-acetyltransferase
MIGPMIDSKYTNVGGGKVILKKFSQLGCNCTVLPALTIAEGVATGAMSLITKDLEPWQIYAGIPATYIKNRNKDLLDYRICQTMR